MQVIGDSFGIDKSTVSRVVHAVSDALCQKMGQFVRFPVDLAAVKTGFFEMAGFPNVVGCIDGTQIRITGPEDHENRNIQTKV